MNLDVIEVKHFSNLADDWWNPKGKLKTLHAINPARLKYINEISGIKGKHILDVGCGGGLLAEGMARHGGMVTGIDASQSLVQVAADHARQESLNIQYETSTIEEFASDNNKKFDLITCMELLEHVPEPEALVIKMSSLLQPEGHLVLSTINRNLSSYLQSIIGAEYLLRILPRNTHQYANFIKPSELSLWLRQAGFDLHDITGLKYIPVLNHVALSADTSVNYMIHAVLRENN